MRRGRPGRAGLAACGIAGLLALGGTPAGQTPRLDAPVSDLQSPDRGVRLRALRVLQQSALPDYAIPVAPLVRDLDDEVQLEAIWTELNIYLADKIVPRRRVGFLVEVRDRIAAEPIFSSGPLALGGDPVPLPVMAALLAAITDDNPRVGVEALYAAGALGGATTGARRAEVQRTAAPRVLALVGATDPTLRFGAVRVIGRLFERLGSEPAVEERTGDAIVAMLNDSEAAIAQAAMQTLGAMRYERAVRALSDLVAYYGRRDLGTSALDALARIGHASSVSTFEAALGGRGDDRRRLAIEGLARSGARAATPTIESAVAATRSAQVRLAGAFAAVLLAGAPIDPLADAIASSERRAQALRYLVEIAAVRPDALAAAAEHPSAVVRLAIVNALGLSRNAAGRAIAEALARDADPDVARAAARTAAWLRPAA